MTEQTLFIGLDASKADSWHDAASAPSLFDYDAVVFNVSAFFDEEIKSITKPWVTKSIAYEKCTPYRDLRQRLLQNTVLLLKKGGTLVCLLSEDMTLKSEYYVVSRKQYDSVFVSNYDWLPFVSSLELMQGRGSRIKITSEAAPFDDYLKHSETYWVTYLNDIEKIRINTDLFGRKQTEPEWATVKVLAYNDAGKAIALNIKVDKGNIILLPLMKHQKSGEILLQCISKFRRKVKTREPPNWLSKYFVPDESALYSKLQDIESKIAELNMQHQAVKAEFDSKTAIKQLLYEGDEMLEDAVKIAFEELCFTISKKGNIDLLIKSDEGEAILEVTGSENAIDLKKIRQLLDYLTREMKDESVKKGVLVANHYINEEPKQRGEPFTEAVVNAAKELDICLLSTIELFNALCRIRENKLDKIAARKKILESVGICAL